MRKRENYTATAGGNRTKQSKIRVAMTEIFHILIHFPHLKYSLSMSLYQIQKQIMIKTLQKQQLNFPIYFIFLFVVQYYVENINAQVEIHNFIAWFLTDIQCNYRILIRILQIQIKEQMNPKQLEDSLFGRELQFVDEQEKIQHQYMCFYDQGDFADSQQKSYDFQNLNLQMLRDCFKSNPNTYEIFWRPHRHYLRHYGYDFNTLSARVAEIPTVYLVTHIQTQHTPIRKHWQLEDSDEETRGSQLGARQVQNANMERIQQTNGCHNQDMEIAQPIEIQTQINNILKENNSNVYNRVNNIKEIKVIRRQLLERKCKTQYNWMKNENAWEKQKKNRRTMYRSTVYYRNKLQKSKKIKNPELKSSNFGWIGALSIKRNEINNKRESPSEEKIQCWRIHEKEKQPDFNIDPEISDGPNLQKINEDIRIIGQYLQQGLKERRKKSMKIDEIVSLDLLINENQDGQRQRQQKRHRTSQSKEVQNRKNKYTKFSNEREWNKTALKQAVIQDGRGRKRHEKMRNEQDVDVS